MDLFSINNGIAIPNEETKNVFPFSIIWQRDTDSHKKLAIKELCYIEFLCSPKRTNPFLGYRDSVERKQKIIANIRKEFPDWEPDDMVEQGVEQWLEFYYNASPALSFYNAALASLENLKTFLTNPNTLAMRTSSGGAVYKPKDITSALADTKSVLANLKALEDEVNNEIFDLTKSKNNRQINRFERVDAS